MKTSLRALLALVSVAACLQAATIIGTPAGAANCFPFGCSGGTRYQQVYDDSNFLGPLTITGLTFYNTVSPGGSVSSRTFTIHLSTTAVAVDALSATMDDNVGPDDALFTIFAGGPGVTGTFTITGSPFYYDPAGGNLLMDIFVSGGTGGGIYLDARSGDAGGVFSRMHDFGSAFEGYGLVTGFETGSAIPEPGSLGLMGLGLALAAWRRRK